ncbi:Putative hypothetical protein [Helicobacter mustelae 12198]|uniref:Uncharacterized protein n=1 Tax=Helicobacter mustelae (strain ATCC 43772 / CCUG 25715 / CIP 103759 / LMG 18044 / NCTC 12198 / R85-136P) TaxID=679897 RepID=D3UGQ7_HELM1|nr:Putative hypothetical protein [Helicobacter mustelae 12198]
MDGCLLSLVFCLLPINQECGFFIAWEIWRVWDFFGEVFEFFQASLNKEAF